MEKIKVVITDYIEPDMKWEEEEFSKMNVDFSYFQLKYAEPKELNEKVSKAEILIVNMAKINSKVINGLENCRLIIRHGVGYDNIDVERAAKKNIFVSYIPDYCTNEVAEQAAMLILACQRKLIIQRSILEDSSKKGVWDYNNIKPIYRLKGKIMGIVGCGRIGSTVYQMMKGFGLKFMIVDPYLSKERKKELGIKKVYLLEEMLKESDIVTIHVSLNDETYHLIDSKELSLMKKSAILVNTSRGSVVNSHALDKALRSGGISYAGLDVYEGEEPPKEDFPLLCNERAIVTPHLSWLSEEASWDIRKKIVEDVRRYLNKEQPRFIINKLKIQFD